MVIQKCSKSAPSLTHAVVFHAEVDPQATHLLTQTHEPFLLLIKELLFSFAQKKIFILLH
jgi:hypothetical protein